MQENLKYAWKRYGPILQALGPDALSSPDNPPYIADELLLHKDAKICVAFAPFKSPQEITLELVTAKVLFVGLTPGRSQACLAIEEFLNPRTNEDNAVSFAGSMRANLIKMLDSVGLPSCLDISSTSDLFAAKDCAQACSTSLLRFPVFVGVAQRNFSGSAALVKKHKFLQRMIEELFLPMFDEIDHSCLIIPMGKTVSYFCEHLETNSQHISVLQGFPHPSGGNGHRVRIFKENREILEEQIKMFGDRLRR